MPFKYSFFIAKLDTRPQPVPVTNYSRPAVGYTDSIKPEELNQNINVPSNLTQLMELNTFLHLLFQAYEKIPEYTTSLTLSASGSATLGTNPISSDNNKFKNKDDTARSDEKKSASSNYQLNS